MTPASGRGDRDGLAVDRAPRGRGRVTRSLRPPPVPGDATMGRRALAPGWCDHGAAAVEFALLLPVLLLVVFGIIDFGRALNAQITLTQAAREGARLAALNSANVVSRTQAAATGLSPVTVTVTSCPAGASQTTDAVVQVGYSFSFITPIGAIAALFGSSSLGSGLSLSATGVMPCGGLSAAAADGRGGYCGDCVMTTAALSACWWPCCSAAACWWAWGPR